MNIAVSAVAGARPVTRVDSRFSVGVHYLRGLAALGVMLYHSSEYINRIMGEAGFRPYLTPVFGLIGVAIFFAVSGYLMAGLIKEQKPAEFLARRVWRIFPLYLLVGVVAVALRHPLHLGTEASYPSALLAPLGYETKQPLGIEWTLISEVYFYVALAGLAAFAATRFLTVIALVWVGAIVVNVLLAQFDPGHYQQTPIGSATLKTLPLMEANLAFAAGLLIPLVPRRPMLWLTLGMAALLLLLLPSWTHRMTAGVAAVLLVAAAAQANFQGSGPLHKVLMALGDWSYALYLVHVVVFKTVMIMCEASGVSPGLGWIFAVASALGIAALTTPVDQAIHNAGKRIIKGANPGYLSLAAIAFVGLYVFVSVP